jgi:hypothetical protein
MDKQTLKEAGYTHLETKGDGMHILLDNNTNVKEVFVANKNFSGWGIIYKNTHLEFMATYYENK